MSNYQPFWPVFPTSITQFVSIPCLGPHGNWLPLLAESPGGGSCSQWGCYRGHVHWWARHRISIDHPHLFFQKPGVSQINLQVTFSVACSVHLRHARPHKTQTIQKQWQYFIKHGSLWIGLGADSCARKKALFESAVAEGNLIAVLQSLVDNMYGSHKGHGGWQKPRCGPWLLQITQLGKGVSPKKLGRRKSASCTAWETWEIAWDLADEKRICPHLWAIRRLSRPRNYFLLQDAEVSRGKASSLSSS